MLKKQVPAKKENGCCSFNCPHCNKKEGNCGLSRCFLGSTPDLKTIKKRGISGYDVVALVEAKTYKVTVLSNSAGMIMQDDIRAAEAVHVKAVEQALKGNVFHYEWVLDKNKPYLFQTTLVPLNDAKNQVTSVLALTRNISDWNGAHRSGKDLLREGALPKTFSQILLAARETEKKEISKALHDEIGSTAVILTALLSVVKASVERGQKKQALKEITDLDKQIKDSIERVKNIVVSLRPPSLENDGALGGAVGELLENISSYVNIPYTYEYKPTGGKKGVSDSVKILLYRIVQEALNNIVKHARATHIYVLLERVAGEIHLIVEDNGIGFKQVKQRSIRNVGLLAMKDSVRLLGGTISIKSAPGKGTRIEVVCPCVVDGGEV